jgi:hypothetical protein
VIFRSSTYAISAFGSPATPTSYPSAKVHRLALFRPDPPPSSPVIRLLIARRAAHSLLSPACTSGRSALRATNGADSTIRTPALRQRETPPKRVPFRRVFRYYFAVVSSGGGLSRIRLVDQPPRLPLKSSRPERRSFSRGERQPFPNGASLGRNAKSREIFLGSKPRKNLYIIANPNAPGRPGARALRAGGRNSRYLRPAAERGTSRRTSCPPAGEHAPLVSRSRAGGSRLLASLPGSQGDRFGGLALVRAWYGAWSGRPGADWGSESGVSLASGLALATLPVSGSSAPKRRKK